jgi:hypothetical protein
MIGIAQVLSSVDTSSVDGPFTMTFVKADGTLRTIKAQKGHKVVGGATFEKSNFRYKIKEKGVILVRDLEAMTKTEEFRTIKISHIIRFNGHEVIH